MPKYDLKTFSTLFSRVIRMATLPSFLCGTALAERAPSDRPNVILIVADDLGYEDIGVYGCKDVPTPNIDRLAATGVRFTAGYVTMPYCAPSRASMVTGQYSSRCGFLRNPTPVLAKDQGLPPGIQTIGGLLQEKGYMTGAIGKWHLGSSPDRHPNSMGFREWFGFLGGGHFYFPQEHYGRQPKKPWPEWYVNQAMPLQRQSKEVAWTGYMTDVLTDEAVSFIDRNKNDPFYLYLAYTAPHTPYEAPEETIKQFKLEDMKPNKYSTPEGRRVYAAMIKEMDDGVGKVVDALARNHLSSNTVACFLSDNGSGLQHYHGSNKPFRGGKNDLYEGGVHVPFIVNWPGSLPAGAVYDRPAISMDIMATAYALAGGDPSVKKLDGVDLIPYLNGQKAGDPHKELFWNHGYGGSAAMRFGNYKLMIFQSGKKLELYDLSKDIGETTDISQSHPEVAQKMFARWKDWQSQQKPTLWIAPPQSEWTNPEYQP